MILYIIYKAKLKLNLQKNCKNSINIVNNIGDFNYGSKKAIVRRSLR
jgi:hypothetical protein